MTYYYHKDKITKVKKVKLENNIKGFIGLDFYVKHFKVYYS